MTNMNISDYIQTVMLTVIILQLYLAYRAFKADHERRRKQATFEFVNAVSDGLRDPLRKFDAKHGDEKIIDYLDYDVEDSNFAKSYLREIERICAGVNSKVFDYDILKKMMASNLIDSNHRFRQYIDKTRINRGRPNLYIEFDHVAKKLRNEKEKKYKNIGEIKYD